MKFNPGDKVKIRDGSWGVMSVNGERKHKGYIGVAEHHEVYTVVSDDPNNSLEVNTGITAPDGYLDGRYKRNTTIIQRGNIVILTHRDFLNRVECSACGRPY